MNETDQLVRELYSTDAPPIPAAEDLWASLEQRIGMSAGTSTTRRRRHRTRFALAFGLALAAAAILALLPALRHSPGGAIPENASAAQVLQALAARGSSLPDVPRGSFLYTAGTRITLSGGPNDDGIYFNAFIRQHWQLWVGRNGSVRQRVRTEPKYIGYPTPSDRRLARRSSGPESFPEDWTTHSRTEFRKDFGMTLRTMRHLPTDASALARAVLANPFAHERSSSKSGLGLVDDAFQGALTILRTPVRPATRAAMWRALATLPHVHRLPDESVGAKPAVAVALRFVIPGTKHGLCDHVLLLDPNTGALLGSRYVYLFATAGLPAGTAINRWTYRQAVVPTLHSRPENR